MWRIVFILFALQAAIWGRGPKTYRNYRQWNTTEAAKKAIEAVKPMFGPYLELHQRVLQHREHTWEIGSSLGTPPTDWPLEFKEYLSEHGWTFSNEMEDAIKRELTQADKLAKDAEAQLKEIVARVKANKNSATSFTLPVSYFQLPPWKFRDYETQLNLSFAMEFHYTDAYKGAHIFSKKPETFAQEFDRVLAIVLEEFGPSIPFIILDDFKHQRTHSKIGEMFEAEMAEFKTAATSVLMLRRQSYGLESIFKSKFEPASENKLDSDEISRLNSDVRRFVLKRRADDENLFRSFESTFKNNTSIEVFASQYILGIYSKIGEVFGQAIDTDPGEYFKGYLKSKRQIPQSVIDKLTAEDTSIRHIVQKHLALTPVFCGESNVISTWESGAEGLEAVRWPYPGDEVTVNGHYAVKLPTEEILKHKREIEIGFKDFIKERELEPKKHHK
jgi:hypothetical protein